MSTLYILLVRVLKAMLLPAGLIFVQPAAAQGQSEQALSLEWWGATEEDRADDFNILAARSYFMDGDGPSPNSDANTHLAQMVQLVEESGNPDLLFKAPEFAEILRVPAGRFVWVRAGFNYRRIISHALQSCLRQATEADCAFLNEKLEAARREKEAQGEPERQSLTLFGPPQELPGKQSGARLIDRLDDERGYYSLRAAMDKGEGKRFRRIAATLPPPFKGGKSNEFRFILAFADGNKQLLEQVVPLMPDFKQPCSIHSIVMENPDLIAVPAGGFQGCDESVTEQQNNLRRFWGLTALVAPQDPIARETAGRAATAFLASFSARLDVMMAESNKAPVFRYFDDGDIPIWRAQVARAMFVPAASADEKTADTILRNLQITAVDASAISVALAAAETQAGLRSPELAETVRQFQTLFNPNTNRVEAKPGVYFSRETLRGAEGQKLRSEMIEQINREFPDYFKIALPQASSLRQTQALLADDEAAIFTVPSGSGTVTFAVTADNFSWSVGDWTTEKMRKAIIRLRWGVGDTSGIPKEIDLRWQLAEGYGGGFARDLAFDLYREVLGGIEPVLEGKRKLIIVAKDDLSALPFDLLITAEPEGSDADPMALRATSWLSDHFITSSVPSIQSLALLRSSKGDTEAERGFLGFGNPSLSETKRIRAETDENGRSRGTSPHALGAIDGRMIENITEMAELPGTKVELRALQSFYNAPDSAVLMGKEATEARFRDEIGGSIGVLSFATHALRPYELAGLAQAAIVLTPGPDANSSLQNDGLLVGSEIASLRINADWIILSACNTGATGFADIAPGSFAGLPEAFLYAGGRSLLVSHWPVKDEIAPVLIARTLELAAQEGTSKAEALNKAMREIRHSTDNPGWAHPYAWAPFSLVGLSE